MDESMLISVLMGLVAAMFGVLILISGWLGNKVYNKLDEMSKSMTSIEKDLHGKISDLDRRMVKVEAVCGPACDVYTRRPV